jgi:hypothetical protein
MEENQVGLTPSEKTNALIRSAASLTGKAAGYIIRERTPGRENPRCPMKQ